jgi:hypothetical protein
MELTPILLRARLSAIFERVAAEHGPVEDVVWELIRCDRCGRIHHLVFDGWTTRCRARLHRSLPGLFAMTNDLLLRSSRSPWTRW